MQVHRIIVHHQYPLLHTATSQFTSSDMDGLETFERMKEFHNEAPVIFLTASGDEDDVMSAIRLGAVNYLKKPFYPQDLLQRIAKELDRK